SSLPRTAASDGRSGYAGSSEALMKIVGVELRELAVDLQFRFETSFGVEQDLRKLILVLRADGLEGYGEVTAGTVPGYSYETTATAWTALHDYVLPRVVGRTFA